jgi:hypothetical protein
MPKKSVYSSHKVVITYWKDKIDANLLLWIRSLIVIDISISPNLIYSYFNLTIYLGSSLKLYSNSVTSAGNTDFEMDKWGYPLVFFYKWRNAVLDKMHMQNSKQKQPHINAAYLKRHLQTSTQLEAYLIIGLE